MLRSLFSALRSFNAAPRSSLMNASPETFLAPAVSNVEQIRTVIKYGYRKGTRKTIKAAVSRFYRLNCGLWIHAIPGRSRRLWKKTPEQIAEKKKHVFCRKRHSMVLDKMVTERWKKPKYLPDSPYEPYDNFQPKDFVYKPWK